MQVWPMLVRMPTSAVMQNFLLLIGVSIPRMKSTDPVSPKFVKYLHKSLLLVYLQLLVAGCLADLVVKEKDIADLQLDQLQTQAELLEDTTLPLQCRRQVKHS